MEYTEHDFPVFDVTVCESWVQGDHKLITLALLDSDDQTAKALRFLRYAYKKGYEDLASFLVENYNFAERLDSFVEKTPLMCACSCNQEGMVDFDALQAYHNPKAVDSRGYTASMLALPHLNLVRKMVENGMLDPTHNTLYYKYNHLTVSVLESLFPTATYLFDTVYSKHKNAPAELGRLYSDIVFANGKKVFEQNDEDYWEFTGNDFVRHTLAQLRFTASVLKVPVRTMVTRQGHFGVVAFDEALHMSCSNPEVIIWMVEQGVVEKEDGSLDEGLLIRNSTKLKESLVPVLEEKCELNASVRLVAKLFEKRTQKKFDFLEGLVGHYAGAGITTEEKRRAKTVLNFLKKYRNPFLGKLRFF